MHSETLKIKLNL